MKKYRITSIPQSLPKAQLGWFKNRRKRISGTGFQKRNKSSQDTEYEEQEVPVQKIKRNSAAPLWEAQSIPVFPNQDFSIENVMPKRTAEEQANTFAEPFFWSQGETIPAHDATYMVQSDPFGESLLRNFHNQSLAGQMGISYSGDKMIPRTVQIQEKFIPDYFKPVTETGENLKCTDGKIAYKGQCVTQEALEIILQRELEIQNFQDNEEFMNKQIEFNNKLLEERKKNYELQQKQADEQRINRINEYLEDFKKSKKKDAIPPLEIFSTEDLNEIIPVTDENGNPVIDEKTGEPKTQTVKEYFKSGYLVIDDYQGYKGRTALWPLEVVGQRIINNGFQPTQFKTLWNFNDNEVKQVKEQLGDVMKEAKDVYDATAYKRIFDKALELGIDPEDAAAQVAGKNSEFGFASALKRDYAPKVEKTINDALDKFFKDARANVDKEDYSYTKGFNFAESEVPVYGKDEDGKEVLLGNTFDPITAHAEWWVSQGKTEKEKQSRRKQVEAIRNKTYADINKQYADVSPQTYINPNVPRSDRMETLQAETNKLNAINENQQLLEKRNAATQDKRYEELAKLTNFSKDFGAYMLSRSGEQIKQTLKNVYNSSNLTDAEKAKILNALNKKDTPFVDNLLKSKYTNAFGQNADQIISELLNPENLAARWEHDQKHSISSFTPRKELTTGEKVWDALSNLDRTAWAAGQAFGSGRDFSDLMWGSGKPTMSNNEWRELARKDPNLKAQLDQRDWLNYNPLSMIGETINAFNPANWSDEMIRGYNESGWSGLRDRTSQLGWDAVSEAAKFIPAGQTASLVKNFAAAKNAFNAAKGFGKILPALNVGFTGLNYGINTLGYPGRYAANWLTKSTIPFAFDAITKEIPEGIEEFSEGNIGTGIGDIAYGVFGALPAVQGIRSINTRIPRIFQYTTPKGRTFGIGNSNLPNITTAEKPEQFISLITSSNAPQLKNLYSAEADIINAEKALASGEAFPRYTFTHPEKTQLQLEKAYQNLGPKEFMLKNLGFKIAEGQPTQFGTFSQPIKYPTRFGEFTFGPKRFYPANFEGIDFKNSTYAPGTGPAGLTGFKNGGYLPKAQYGIIGETTSALSKTLRNLPSIYTSIAEGENLFKHAWKSPAMRFDLNASNKMFLSLDRMPQSQALFNAIQTHTPETTLNKILAKDYEISSSPYTGRHASQINEEKKQMLSDMLKTAKISSQEPIVLSRRINLDNPELYSLESGIYRPNRPLSFSAGRDAVGNQSYSGGSDRLVMRLKPGEYNIFKNPYQTLDPDELLQYEEFLRRYGARTLPEFTTQEMIDNNIGMSKFNRIFERELITPYEASFGELGRVKNNFGGFDVVAEPIDLKIKQPTWVRPSNQDLMREFNVEHEKKGLGFFNSEGDFINAANQGVVRNVTPDLDLTIGNRSFTPTAQDLINLSKGYRSWGSPYRNEGTIQSIYEGLNQGGNMTMPMVIEYGDGFKRILSGNTRMDAARHLGLTPQALFIKAPFKKGGVSLKLSKKEIDQYIKDGYIVEDE